MLKPVKSVLRQRPFLDHASECDLAFRWQHERDWRALAELVESFEKLVLAIASERFRAAQLDKGVKVVELEKARKNPELAGHFLELVQAGQVGLLEAVEQYNGQWRFATYACHWVFKRMQEYIRSNWHVVRMPEPAEWKVAKEDKIPPTIPNTQLNPFENPYSPDKKAKHSRAAQLASPIEREDNVEENVVGRFGLNTANYEQDVFGTDQFESGEYQARAHESMEAYHRAIELETLSAELDARMTRLPRREYQIIRARFPWAVDVNNAPEREDDHGFPKRHKRWVIGLALGISDERVRQIEEGALDAMGSRARPDHWVDRLVKLIGSCFVGPTKRWLPPKILCEEEIAKRIRVNGKVAANITRAKRVDLSANSHQPLGPRWGR